LRPYTEARSVIDRFVGLFRQPIAAEGFGAVLRVSGPTDDARRRSADDVLRQLTPGVLSYR
jgi:hypothetical protein